MTELPIGEAAEKALALTSRSPRRRRSNWQDLGGSPLSIQRIALPLPGRQRAAWRVAALTICLGACRGRSATVEQLHILMWALRDRDNANQLRKSWERGPVGSPFNLRAWDPGLDDTLRLARAEGLVEIKPNGRQVLTALGITLLSEIRRDADSPMADEQRFLATLGQISESGMWRRLGTPPRLAQSPDAEGSR